MSENNQLSVYRFDTYTDMKNAKDNSQIEVNDYCFCDDTENIYQYRVQDAFGTSLSGDEQLVLLTPENVNVYVPDNENFATKNDITVLKESHDNDVAELNYTISTNSNAIKQYVTGQLDLTNKHIEALEESINNNSVRIDSDIKALEDEDHRIWQQIAGIAERIGVVSSEQTDLNNQINKVAEELESNYMTSSQTNKLFNNLINDQVDGKIDTAIVSYDAKIQPTINEHETRLTTLEETVNNLNPDLDPDTSNFVTKDQYDADQIKIDDQFALVDDQIKIIHSSVAGQGRELDELSKKVEDIDDSFATIQDVERAKSDAIGTSINSVKGILVDYPTKDEIKELGVSDKYEELTNSVNNLQNDLNEKYDELSAELNSQKDIIDTTITSVESNKESLDTLNKDLSDYKKEVEDTYAKPEDVSRLLNTYAPGVDNYNKWIGSDLAGELAGKTGKEVASEAYSYSAVLDQILFNDFTPTISDPSVEVAINEKWMDDVAIDWYNEKDRVIMVKAGTVGPDGADFLAVNVKNAEISYPKGLNFAKNFTDGLLPSSDENPSSVGFCKVKDENGDWVYYRREGTRYHVPSVLEPGSYRYHYVAFFRKGYPAVNNEGLTINEWSESTPVESQDFITINASKPIYYNTLSGMVEKELKVWDDELMSDTAELLPSCVAEQSFMVPRKLKTLYIWNDLLGGYGVVPMVKELDEEGLPTENIVPAYFNESIDENGYYIYKYNSNDYGHRGAIKIKVDF